MYPCSYQVPKGQYFIVPETTFRKICLLLTLTSAESGSELVTHDLRFMNYHPEGVEFNLPKFTKSVRFGKQLKVSFHASFPQDKLLCPCECLKAYEARTAAFRPLDPGQPTKLFLATIRPHKPVRFPTLAKWIRNLLSNSGIDSTIFKGHSTRGIASSTPLGLGSQ